MVISENSNENLFDALDSYYICKEAHEAVVVNVSAYNCDEHGIIVDESFFDSIVQSSKD